MARMGNDGKPKEVMAALKVLSRAPGIDDPRNEMKAYAAVGEGKKISWLVYVADADYEALGAPSYISMYVESGANVVLY